MAKIPTLIIVSRALITRMPASAKRRNEPEGTISDDITYHRAPRQVGREYASSNRGRNRSIKAEGYEMGGVTETPNWRPIATAPCGERVMLAHEASDGDIAWMAQGVVLDDSINLDDLATSAKSKIVTHPATHWMPLAGVLAVTPVSERPRQ
jgi:hypothetical protein